MYMQDVDLGLLRCFVTVAETRSFTLAGDRLGRSQSAISVRIKRLEDVVGAPLLTRNSQDVRLTRSGDTLLPKARHLLSAGEALMAEMHSPPVTGALRLGVLEYVAPQRLPVLLDAIQRSLPEADLRFVVGLSRSLRADLEAGDLDLVLALHDPGSETSSIVASDPLVWVEGAGMAETHGWEEGIPLCLMRAPCLYRQVALQALASYGAQPIERLTADSVHAVRHAVLSGLGVSVLGASSVGEGLRISHRLAELGPLPPATLSLHGTDPRKAQVRDALRQVLDAHMLA
ncbi:MAG: LysR family transcriptional regulator [Pseudomonadota bacterium]